MDVKALLLTLLMEGFIFLEVTDGRVNLVRKIQRLCEWHSGVLKSGLIGFLKPPGPVASRGTCGQPFLSLGWAALQLSLSYCLRSFPWRWELKNCESWWVVLAPECLLQCRAQGLLQSVLTPHSTLSSVCPVHTHTPASPELLLKQDLGPWVLQDRSVPSAIRAPPLKQPHHKLEHEVFLLRTTNRGVGSGPPWKSGGWRTVPSLSFLICSLKVEMSPMTVKSLSISKALWTPGCFFSSLWKSLCPLFLRGEVWDPRLSQTAARVAVF